jgi:hypothetical protein
MTVSAWARQVFERLLIGCPPLRKPEEVSAVLRSALPSGLGSVP